MIYELITITSRAFVFKKNSREFSSLISSRGHAHSTQVFHFRWTLFLKIVFFFFLIGKNIHEIISVSHVGTVLIANRNFLFSFCNHGLLCIGILKSKEILQLRGENKVCLLRLKKKEFFVRLLVWSCEGCPKIRELDRRYFNCNIPSRTTYEIQTFCRQI